MFTNNDKVGGIRKGSPDLHLQQRWVLLEEIVGMCMGWTAMSVDHSSAVSNLWKG